jgi:HMG (high mobility group) box
MTDQNDDIDSTAAITDISRKWKSEPSWSRKEDEDSSTIASVPTGAMESFVSSAVLGSDAAVQYSSLDLLRNDERLEEKKQDTLDNNYKSLPNTEQVDSRHDMDSVQLVKQEIGDPSVSTAGTDEEPLHSSPDLLSPQGPSRRRAMLISIHKELQKRNEMVAPPDQPFNAIPSNTTESVDLHKKRRGRQKKDLGNDGSPQKRSKSDTDASNQNEKPEPPMYAYELFSRDYQRAYQAANRHAADAEEDPASHLSEMILQRWNEMSSQEKQPYVVRATEDQKNFKQQIEAWNQNHDGIDPIDSPGLEDTAPSVDRAESSQQTENQSDDLHPREQGIPERESDENAPADQATQKSQKPRGRPKVGYEWDRYTGQWRKQAEASNRSENRQGRNSTDNTKDASWYSNLQSSPVRLSDGAKNQPSRQLGKSAKPETAKAEAPSGGNTISVLRKNPKTVPKIKSDGTYRKPPGTQPMGYVWNAESGYWESAVDENMKKLLDFDDEGPPRDGVDHAERRMSILGSAKPAGGKKRHYTKDGCIVPNQTLERNRDGTYVRPMGRPLVGYTWNEVRGLWVPNASSSSFNERQSISSAAPDVHGDTALVNVDRRHSEPSMRGTKHALQQTSVPAPPMKKGRKYTPDGCIVPSRIPQLATDGTYVRPLGRAIVGYTWDSSRGLWTPEGSIGRKPTKQAQSLASVVAPVTESRSTVAPMVKKGPRYMSCARCVGCKTKKNCGICLHCMLIAEAINDGELPSPFYVCMQRVCSAPIVNINQKSEGNSSTEPNPGTVSGPRGNRDESADTAGDNSVLESVSDNHPGNISNDDVSDLEDSENDEDGIDVCMAEKKS